MAEWDEDDEVEEDGGNGGEEAENRFKVGFILSNSFETLFPIWCLLFSESVTSTVVVDVEDLVQLTAS
jgi:hypothetical protein